MQWQDGYIIPSTDAGIGVALSEEVAYDVILIKQTGLYEY